LYIKHAEINAPEQFCMFLMFFYQY